VVHPEQPCREHRYQEPALLLATRPLGQSLVEYGLVIGLVAVVGLAATFQLGSMIQSTSSDTLTFASGQPVNGGPSAGGTGMNNPNPGTTVSPSGLPTLMGDNNGGTGSLFGDMNAGTAMLDAAPTSTNSLGTGTTSTAGVGDTRARAPINPDSGNWSSGPSTGQASTGTEISGVTGIPTVTGQGPQVGSGSGAPRQPTRPGIPFPTDPRIGSGSLSPTGSVNPTETAGANGFCPRCKQPDPKAPVTPSVGSGPSRPLISSPGGISSNSVPVNPSAGPGSNRSIFPSGGENALSVPPEVSGGRGGSAGEQFRSSIPGVNGPQQSGGRPPDVQSSTSDNRGSGALPTIDVAGSPGGRSGYTRESAPSSNGWIRP
jgi:hypothetical protein